MIKSMTGFSKVELSENGINVAIEIKSLNGKYLEINCRMPRNLQHKENEIRDIVRKNVLRGSLNVNITIETDEISKSFNINTEAAKHIYTELGNLRKELKIKEVLKLEQVLAFSDFIMNNEEAEDENKQLQLIKKALNNCLKNLDSMKRKEGQNLLKDLNNRIKNISNNINKVEQLGIQRVPQERERLKQRLAHFFENDEYDEQRIQIEMVLMADKLDISEEIVRLNSHFKFYNDIIKNDEAPGRKINFLLQEINREVNTIGSKANDATISQIIVNIKEELEKIREQIQNIE